LLVLEYWNLSIKSQTDEDMASWRRATMIAPDDMSLDSCNYDRDDSLIEVVQYEVPPSAGSS
jgi:hypothetical protein